MFFVLPERFALIDTLDDNVLRSSWNHLLKGEEKGISALYDIMWEKLYSYAARMLQDKAAASDIIQELFINLWEKHTTLPEVMNVEGYLFKSLKRAIINHLSSAGVREKHTEAFNRALLKTDDLTLEIIYHKELFKRIKESSEDLPSRMKVIFQMNRFDDKSVREIAEELNLSEQTVRNQINLAIKKIRPIVMETFSLYIVIYPYI